MTQTIIADSSCLIVLANIGHLEVLHELFGKIVITPAVAREFGSDLPEWINVSAVIDENRLAVFELILDAGEAASIVMALETENPLLILDEKKARRVAKDLGLQITGTITILLKATKRGLIENASELPRSLENANFRLSKDLKKLLLQGQPEQP